MKENISNEKSIVSALLQELTKLNEQIDSNRNLSEIIKNSGIFLFGFNPMVKVDVNAYRKYVSFINAITHILDEFDINKRNNGYAYIIDAVMLIMDQNRLDIRLGDDVYPYIKEKYGLNSAALVEHNIRNAIKSSYLRHKKGKSISRMNLYNSKPTNKEFLVAVTHDVCRRMCSDLVCVGI